MPLYKLQRIYISLHTSPPLPLRLKARHSLTGLLAFLSTLVGSVSSHSAVKPTGNSLQRIKASWRHVNASFHAHPFSEGYKNKTTFSHWCHLVWGSTNLSITVCDLAFFYPTWRYIHLRTVTNNCVAGHTISSDTTERGIWIIQSYVKLFKPIPKQSEPPADLVTLLELNWIRS